MRKTISLNYDWSFTPEFKKSYLGKTDNPNTETVHIPHTFKELPLNYFDEKSYQFIGLYSKNIEITSEMLKDRVYIEFKAVMTKASVYLNKELLTVHEGGYTPFVIDITEVANDGVNLLQVVVDSNEIANIPPFGNHVDYLCFSGIYREVNLLTKPKTHISRLQISTDEGFAGSDSDMITRISLSLNNDDSNDYTTRVILTNEGKEVLSYTFLDRITHDFDYTLSVTNIKRWDVDSPNLYTLKVDILNGDKVVDSISTKIGYRTARFTPEGFFLNNKPLKLLGLNRHQSYPYVGYAMPKSMQELDADIVKDLGCNIVRTSHYMQSDHFINRCDEIGLLVLEEIPGWQYIGDDHFKNLTYENIKDMILNHYNHPSIITWGVRINESADDHEFYAKTNELARILDNTRQTCGIRNTKKGDFLEDVYTYNDFSHVGDNPGLEKPNKVAGGHFPYLVTEHNGHIFPTKKTDSELHRLEQALRHTTVIDHAYSNERYSGAIGWCLADYNTHYNFGSNDQICHHGVTDMFRIPKYAAYTYKAQRKDKPVLFVASNMVSGDYKEFILPETVVFTNCDYIKVYRNNEYIGDFYSEWERFNSIPNAPIIFDDYIGEILVNRGKYKEKDARKISDVIYAFSKYGFKAPLKAKLKYLNLKRRKVIDYKDMVELVGDFAMLQTNQPTVFKFEGYMDDSLVIETSRGNTLEVNLSVEINHKELVHGYTYDVARVVVKLVDEFGYELPYINELIEIKTKNLELIGPDKLTLTAGSTAFYVKTTDIGKGSITIKDQRGHKEIIHVEIKKGKLEI